MFSQFVWTKFQPTGNMNWKHSQIKLACFAWKLHHSPRHFSMDVASRRDRPDATWQCWSSPRCWADLGPSQEEMDHLLYRTHNNGLILVEGLWKVSRQVFTVSSHSRQLGKWFESTRFRGIEYVGIIWIVWRRRGGLGNAGHSWKDAGNINRYEEWRRTTNSEHRFTSIHLGQSPTLTHLEKPWAPYHQLMAWHTFAVPVLPYIQWAREFAEDVMFFSRYHWCCPISSPCPCSPWEGSWEKRAWRNLEPRLHRTGHRSLSGTWETVRKLGFL